MDANVWKLLNEQVNKEFYSADLYLDLANYYASVGLPGFETWYKVQAQEERDHAMLFYPYLQNNGEPVCLEAIARPAWERGEEEKSASDLITKMALFGGDGKGPYMLNSELKGRAYAAPSLVR